MIDEIDNYDMEVFIAFQKVIHEPETLKVIEQSRLIIDLDYDKFMKILETRTK